MAWLSFNQITDSFVPMQILMPLPMNIIMTSVLSSADVFRNNNNRSLGYGKNDEPKSSNDNDARIFFFFVALFWIAIHPLT